MRFSEISGYTDISVDDEHGGAEGYVVNNTSEQITNYLNAQGADPSIANDIKDNFKRIAIFRNLWVEDDNRGKGIGGNLVAQFIDNAFANGAEVILLVADMSESNEHLGKTLQQWYQGYGFETVGDAGGNPIMLLRK